MTARWGALVLIPVLLPMAGCTQYWAKPGGTQEQFAVTKSACQAQSYAQFPPAPQQVMLTAGYTTPQQSTCSGNGYMVNCYTTGGQYMPPTYVTLDQNSGARDSGFQSCLMNAGWRLAKNKEEAEAIARSGYAPPVVAASAAGPKSIAKFDDWTAATHDESGVMTCYAFTRAATSSPALPGRGAVILTVTQRPSLRDAVAIEAGFPFAANATVTVQVDQAGLDFYTDKRNAFARDGKAAAAAFQKGPQAVVRSPGPDNAPVTDTFSLKGFSPAYAAIVKACPPK